MTTKFRSLQLPEELVFEILSWVPINELTRCKCVCKSWRSLIGDPQFQQTYRSRDRGMMLYWSEDGHRTGNFRLYFSPPTPRWRDEEEELRLLRELNVGRYSGECRLINGLICVRESPSDALSIYSVCRGEKMRVPEPLPSHHTESSYHFRFDPVSRRYKLLRLIFEENPNHRNLQALHIITLQPSGLQSQWRKLDNDAAGISILPGGFLRFIYSSVTFPRLLRYSGDVVVCWLSFRRGVIVFDIHQERFRWFKLPADLEVILKEVPPKQRNRMIVLWSQFKEQRLTLSLRLPAEEKGGAECFIMEDDEGENWSRQFVSFPREEGGSEVAGNEIAVLNSDSHWVVKIREEFLKSREHYWCIHERLRPAFCSRLSFLPNSYDHLYFSLDDLLGGRT